MLIPFLDLKAHHDPIRQEIDHAISQVINQGAFAGGPFVERFEKEFADYCDTRHAVAVGSGTVALWLSLLALGVGPGDDVITVPSTFIATAEAITFTGARPVFVDIDEATCLMNPKLLESAITPQTKAILPVHLFGQTADMQAILDIAHARGIPVIEDACQAHGARHHENRAGSMGKAGCFSFYPGKNLGAFGEGGAVVTNDDTLAYAIRVLRDHGQTRKYFHQITGWNGRMGGIEAAVLSVKLKHLDANNEKRRRLAKLYDAQLRHQENIRIPHAKPYNKHVYHVYALRLAKKRDDALNHLEQSGIRCGIHYPIPLHMTQAYANLRISPGTFPVAEKSASQFLSLPMYPELEPTAVDKVAMALKTFLSHVGSEALVA